MAKHQDLLHFSKCYDITKLLNKAKKDAINSFPDKENKYFPLLFQNHPAIRLLIRQMNDFIDRIEFLDIYTPIFESLKNRLNILSNYTNNLDAKQFERNVNSIFKLIKEIKKNELQKKLDLFSCEECGRLDEAISDFRNNCFLSSVIMVVSAVEARLNYLIKSKNKTIYNQCFEDKPLGTLISLFDPNQYKDKKYKSLKNILPEEHKPLIQVFNTYRIYSAHPKGKKIGQKIAQSILNLTFAFLLDERLKIKPTQSKIPK